MKYTAQKEQKMKKILVTMLVFTMFVSFNYVRAIVTINELKAENQELIEMLDYQVPTEEEND